MCVIRNLRLRFGRVTSRQQHLIFRGKKTRKKETGCLHFRVLFEKISKGKSRFYFRPFYSPVQLFCETIIKRMFIYLKGKIPKIQSRKKHGMQKVGNVKSFLCLKVGP